MKTIGRLLRARPKETDLERTLQNYRTAGCEVLGCDQERVETMERGLRWAVEATRNRRETERKPITGTEGLVRGKDDRRQTDETSGKGKGKGNGGKGEHRGKGGFGSKGTVEDLRQHEEDERVRVAPNREAGGSHAQATSDLGEEEAEEEEKGARRLRWADCDDEKEKEKQE